MIGLLIRTVVLLALAGTVTAREVTNFNEGWRFARFGAMPDGSKKAEPEGLEKVTVEDATWRSLNLPHDWAIEGPFRMDLPNRTGKLPYEGIGWYRKSFTVSASDQGKHIFIDFDGAMSRSTIYINGQYAGEWPYGYSSFRIELTDHIKFGSENVIAVRLDNKGNSSRWYPGGGIYRNVRLVKTAPVHVNLWGVRITTPVVKDEFAIVQVVAELCGLRGVGSRRDACDTNERAAGVSPATEEKDASVKMVHEVYAYGSDEMIVRGEGICCSIPIPQPKLWDLESPNLYVLKTIVLENGKEVDAVENQFGIRTIEYTADRGFLLNGNVVRMNGVCMHHDLGPLGAAVNVRALERQVEILKEMGCNAIRTSHNPPTPELLDLCDRMGMLLQVEAFDCWKTGKIENDYSTLFEEWYARDLTAMIRRDRNHPSVVMWSTGNEVREQWNKGDNFKISQMLTDRVHQLDPTRPVSVGCNNGNAGWNGFEKTIDLFGYNYKPHLYAKFKEKHPHQPVYGSETASTLSSRGEYFFPLPKKKTQGMGGYFQVSSYDLTATSWSNIPDVDFAAQDKLPYVFGEFVWTGFDYIGEPTPYNNDKTNLLNISDPAARKRMEEELEKRGGNLPPRSSYFGILDLCGFKKDRFYIYQARWRPELPMAHILPHWNWPERVGKVTPVHVYTSGDEAELFLNGQSLGRKKKGPYEYRLRWDEVVYVQGELKVVAYKNGKPWAEEVMKTTGKAAKVDLSADRSVMAADGKDLSFITVQISDQDGLLVPRTDHEVEFKIEGPGKILAVGNGNPASHEPFQANKRKAFNGLCLVIVQSEKGKPGTIRLTAKADGLRESTLELKTEVKDRCALNCTKDDVSCSQIERPNVVMIYTDDLGIGMLGCYGQKVVKTPNIDRLAVEGMKFGNYYGGVLCAPARWTLLTGMHDGRQGGWGQNAAGLLVGMDRKNTPEEEYMQRFDAYVNKTAEPIPDNEVFLAQVAKQAGYKTAQFGKLDVGFLTNHERVKRFGWDYYEGYFSHMRAHGFYPPYLWRNGEKFKLEGNTLANCGKRSEKGDEPVGSGGATYSQNVFIEGILNFIRENKDNPFFLYHSTQLPHGPVAIPELHPDYADHPTFSLAEKKYASMIRMLDDHVGLIMDELTVQGIDEKTIVFFTSDNGHELYYGPKWTFPKKRPGGEAANLTDKKWRTSECGDVFDGAGGRAGLKRAAYQGGMQCPMLVRWPGRIKPGSENNLLSTHYDFMATMAELIGTERPNGKDSISYLPALFSKSQEQEHDYIVVNNGFDRMGRTALIRRDGWKLVEIDRDNDLFQLYNLNKDNEERFDLSGEYPERVVELKGALLRELDSLRQDI